MTKRRRTTKGKAAAAKVPRSATAAAEDSAATREFLQQLVQCLENWSSTTNAKQWKECCEGDRLLYDFEEEEDAPAAAASAVSDVVDASTWSKKDEATVGETQEETTTKKRLPPLGARIALATHVLQRLLQDYHAKKTRPHWLLYASILAHRLALAVTSAAATDGMKLDRLVPSVRHIVGRALLAISMTAAISYDDDSAGRTSKGLPSALDSLGSLLGLDQVLSWQLGQLNAAATSSSSGGARIFRTTSSSGGSVSSSPAWTPAQLNLWSSCQTEIEQLVQHQRETSFGDGDELMPTLLDWGKEETVWKAMTTAAPTQQPSTNQPSAPPDVLAAAASTEASEASVAGSEPSDAAVAPPSSAAAKRSHRSQRSISSGNSKFTSSRRQSSSSAAEASSKATSSESAGAATAWQLFQEESISKVEIDGRLPCRRWTSAALVWYFQQGQSSLLENAAALLQSECVEQVRDWISTLRDQAHAGNLKSEEDVDGGKKMEAVTEADENETDDKGDLCDPNVLVMCLVSRVARIAYDLGVSSGNRPSHHNGGVELYLKSLLAHSQPRSGSSSASSSTASSALGSSTRTDIRHPTTALMLKILDFHWDECLATTNLGRPELVNEAADNDEEGSHIDEDTGNVGSDNKKTIATFYPYVSQTIQDLARAAATTVPSASASMVALSAVEGSSSSSSSNGDSGVTSLERIVTLASAYTVQKIRHYEGVKIGWDVALVRSAVRSLTKCLTTSSAASGGISAGKDPADSLPSWLQLDRNLRLMTSHSAESGLPFSADATTKSSSTKRASRKRKSTSASSGASSKRQQQQQPTDSLAFLPDPDGTGSSGAVRNVPSFCSYGGIFADPKSSGSLSAELLSLFFRAMHGNQNAAAAVASSSKGRAIVAAAGPDTSVYADETARALLTVLIRIVRVCYTVATPNSISVKVPELDEGESAPSSTTSVTTRKRRLELPRRGKKRRKVASEAGVEEAKVEPLPWMSNQFAGPMSLARVALASETLSTLCLCFPKRPRQSSSSSSGQRVYMTRLLERLSGQALSTEIISSILDFGVTMDQLIRLVEGTGGRVSSKDEKVNAENDYQLSTEAEKGARNASAAVALPTAEENQPRSLKLEKQIWESYTDLCLCVGQGRKPSLTIGVSGTKSAVLGPELRMDVYSRIASFGGSSSTSWPLWLPASHRILIVSNIAAEPIGSTKQATAPDRLITDGFVASIANALSDPSASLVPNEGREISPASLFVEECIPLSLANSQLFVAAVLRLPVKDRVVTMQHLFDVVQAGLDAFAESPDLQTVLAKYYSVSTFLGRTISLCTSLAIALTCYSNSSEVGPALIEHFGKSSQGCFLVKSEPVLDEFRSRNCFFDVLSMDDCSDESRYREPYTSARRSAKSSGIGRLALSSMKKEVAEQLQQMLEKALRLSFISASVDRCYFLYASWIAIGKSGLWTLSNNQAPGKSSTSGTAEVQPIITEYAPDSGNDEEHLTSVMLQMRKELCDVYRLMHKLAITSAGSGQRSCDMSPLLQIIEANSSIIRKGTTSSARRTALAQAVKAALAAMSKKASAICNDLLNRFVVEDDDMAQPAVPLPALVILEMLCAYTTFAVSFHTKPEQDFFSSTRSNLAMKHHKSSGRSKRKKRRARGYSSGSEPFSCEDDEEAAVNEDDEGHNEEGDDDEDNDAAGDSEDALELETWDRITAVCSAAGGAPAHPDWLAEDVTFWEPLSEKQGLASAMEALETLTKLAKVARRQARLAKCRSVTRKTSSAKTGAIINLAYNLSMSEAFDGGPPGDCGFNKSIAQVVQSLQDSSDDDGVRINQEVLDLWSNDSQIEQGRTTAKHSWAPATALHILGAQHQTTVSLNTRTGNPAANPDLLASGSVLRVCSEWEVLLSQALSVCGTNSAAAAAHMRSRTDLDFDSLDLAARWNCIYKTATSSLVPPSALLRYSINDHKGRTSRGTGRSTHPLNSIDLSVEDFDIFDIELKWITSPTFQDDFVKVATAAGTTTEHVKQAVTNTMNLVTTDFRSDLETPCECVAMNLMVEPESNSDNKAFGSLRFIEACRFALATLERLVVSVKSPPADPGDIQCLVSKLVTILDSHGGGGSSRGTDDVFVALTGSRAMEKDFLKPIRNVSHILVALSMHDRTFGTVAATDNSVLSLERVPYFRDPASSDSVVSALVSLIYRRTDCAVSPQTRLQVLRCLISLAASGLVENTRSDKFSPLDSIVKAVNSRPDDDLMALVKHDICRVEDDETSNGAGSMLCVLLATLLGSCNGSGESNFTKVQLIPKVLDAEFSGWGQHQGNDGERTAVLFLWFLCCSYGNQLASLSSRLVSELVSHREANSDVIVDVQNLSSFGYMAEEFKQNLAAVNHSSIAAAKKAGSKETLPPPPYQLCSYALETGFVEQHWYNCFTCGLTGDKGCCTVCALHCHDGHEVSYSRFSTFFCDCAAPDESGEAGSSSSGNPSSGTSGSSGKSPVCKCLTPLSAEVAAKAFARGQGRLTADLSQPVPCPDDEYSEGESSFPVPDLSVAMCSFIAAKVFPKRASESLDTLVSHGLPAGWTNVLFEVIRDGLDIFSSVEVVAEDANASSAATACNTYQELRRRLCRRRESNVVAVVAGDSSMRSLTKIASIRAGAFQGKISTESSTESAKRALLLSGGAFRSVISADRRGRIVMAEPNVLLFGTALPLLNNSALSGTGTQLPRSALGIVKKKTLGYNAVGVRHCKANDANLLVWGFKEASVCILNEMRTDFTKKIDLIFDWSSSSTSVEGSGSSSSGATSSEFIVSCDFLAGSTSCIIATCVSRVFIFDIAKSKSVAAMIMVGSDSCFRGLVSTEILGVDTNTIAPTQTSWRVYLLMDDGHLHSFDVNQDPKALIEVRNLNLESKSSVKLPIGGEKNNDNVPFSLTLGEGIHLSMLEQSRLLLYQVVSEPILALQLDDNGRITSSFTLLPRELPSHLFEGSGAVRGPFTHWTELGVIRHGGTPFFRVTCLGRRTTKDVALLCVEFNETETRVREIPLNASAGTHGIPVEGIVAVSCPGRHRDAFCTAATNPAPNMEFNERAAICVYLTNGSVRLFGEELGTPCFEPNHPPGNTAAALPQCIATDDIKPAPLLAFEKLTNAMEAGAVEFDGEGLGSSEDIHLKLERDRAGSLTAPAREGFTMMIKLQPASTSANTASKEAASTMSTRNTVIAAVRFLVGSHSTDSIPKKVTVVGRQVDLLPGRRKIYSFHLTSTEIAIAVRTGFITFSIGPTFDNCTCPAIDSLEVYTAERDTFGVNWWLPRRLESVVARSSSGGLTESDRESSDEELAEKTASLVTVGLEALQSFCRFFGPPKPLPAADEILLKQLVKETALSESDKIPKAVDVVLASYDLDEEARLSFRDKAVLQRCCEFVSDCLAEFNKHKSSSSSSEGSSFETWFNSTGNKLGNCFRTALKIGKRRPNSYFQSIDDRSSSPGASASKFMPEVFARSALNLDLVSEFVELCLVEMAVAVANSSGHVRFEGLRRLLLSENHCILALVNDTITKFCHKYQIATSPSQGDEGCDLFSQKMIAVYGCDSCTVLPIPNFRYSLVDEARPFDLCQKCYHSALEYARTNDFNAEKEVRIHNKTIGEDDKLTCADVQAMKQIGVYKRGNNTTTSTSDADGDAVVKEKNEDAEGEPKAGKEGHKSSELVDATSGGPEFVPGHQVFDDFMEKLFERVLGLLVAELNKASRVSSLSPLIQVAINLVNESGKGARRADRARRLSKELVAALSRALRDSTERTALVLDLLRALVRIVLKDHVALTLLTSCGSYTEEDDANGGNSEQQTPTCEVHGVPSVRKKCREGKDYRHFLVCGKDKKIRCNFFAWADGVDGRSNKRIGTKAESVVDDATAHILWDMLTSPLPGRGSQTTIQALLCQFVTRHITQSSFLESNAGPTPDQISLAATADMIDSECADGVPCARARLSDVTPREFIFSVLNRTQVYDLLGLVPMPSLNDERKPNVIETSLTLLALVGRPTGGAMLAWSPLLSEIILSLSENDTTPLKSLAKRALMWLCGRKRGLYACLRAHFSFAHQRQKLASLTWDLLSNAIMMVEKARACGPNWKRASTLSPMTLKAADLLGVDELISEDVTTVRVSENVRQVLVQLNAVAKKRADNWRQFCGLPHFEGSRSLAASAEENSVSKIPPVVFLFSIACLLRGENQVRVFRLLDLCLSSSCNKKQAKQKGPEEDEATETASENVIKETTAFPYATSTTPEVVLGLTVQDLFVFAARFVCRGSSADLRSLATGICSKVCMKSPQAVAGELFQLLLQAQIPRLGEMGRTGTELVSLLQSLAQRGHPSQVKAASSAKQVLACYRAQIQAIRHGRQNKDYVYFEARTATTNQKKRYELSRCVHCQHTRKERTGSKSSNSGQQAESSNAPQPQSQPSSNQSSADAKPWHPCQVTPYSRGRLEGWRDGATSDEFNTYASFKYRLSLSEVHLEISDPRGRFVKLIRIYFTPRPVADVTGLKCDSYADKWQLCGTMEFGKGSNRGSCILEQPVVAANIRIEYSDFYERPGDASRADSNSFVVHCPRCSRVVNNAHGVCGNCGECSFQCRKCRHINYERLDAFLCVECGYCASGGFCYELTAAIASNAIAICSDADYQRASRMLAIANRLYEDLRSTLQDKLLIMLRRQSGESSMLKRAYQGGLPLQPEDSDTQQVSVSKIKPGSVVKAVARPDGRDIGSANSLVRLTREWRETTADARRPAVRRQLSRLLAHDSDHEDSERFGWLEGSSLSVEDPLSRLLASVQNRRRTTSSNEDGNNAGGNSGSGKATAQLTKETLEACDRLYALMREAERESHGLQERIEAWQRLETDSLKATCICSADGLSFEPSHCSVCASPVAVQLLSLWLTLLASEPDNVEITKDMVRALLSEDYFLVNKPLLDVKRAAVKQIALLSQKGAQVVLEALRVRFEVAESVACAEILGKIVEAPGSPPEFRELALHVLDMSAAADIP